MNTEFNLDLSDVFSYVDSRREEFLGRLVDYLRRPSISAHGLGIADVAEYIAAVMKRMKLQTQIIPTAGWPMVFGQDIGKPGAPTILLYGHYDVQPPEPLEEWITPPFEPAVRNGRLYARGVGDNKGQHFAQLLAIESLLACRSSLPCNIKFLLEGEEEIGSPQMPAFVQEHRDELKADLVIISDGPVHTSGRSQILFGVRGVLSFELQARGANRDLHSGNWGGIAPNPLWTLVHLLATMKNEQGEITIEGFYDNVQPQTPLEREALAQLPVNTEDIKQSLDLQQLDQPPSRRLWRSRIEDGSPPRSLCQMRYPPRRSPDRQRNLCQTAGPRPASRPRRQNHPPGRHGSLQNSPRLSLHRTFT